MGLKPCDPPPYIVGRWPAPPLRGNESEKLRIENDHLREQVSNLLRQLGTAELEANRQRAKLKLAEEKLQREKDAFLDEVSEQPISYFGEHDTMLVSYSRWRSNQALQLHIRALYSVCGFTVALSAVLILDLVYCALTGVR